MKLRLLHSSTDLNAMICYSRVMPQKITLILRPESAFELPLSEGYQLYSGLLAVMEKADPDAAKRAHDSPIGSISLGSLEGRFGRCESKRARHKSVDPAEKYRLSLGITDPQESELFRSIIQPLVLREQNLILEKGELRVEELSSTSATFEELLKSSAGLKEPFIDLHFSSPACIQYKNTKIYEMFPHREAVFNSLLSKWNSVCTEEIRMSIERDDMARFMIEKPMAYETRSVVVNTVFDKTKGHARPIMRQGFSGRCQYTFARGAPEGFKNGMVALAKFAEYSGVGSAVARGCGAVKVEVGEGR